MSVFMFLFCICLLSMFVPSPYISYFYSISVILTHTIYLPIMLLSMFLPHISLSMCIPTPRMGFHSPCVFSLPVCVSTLPVCP